MSGGHFEYQQYRIEDIASEIDHLIEVSGSDEKDQWGYLVHTEYSQETIEKFKETSKTLRIAAAMAQRVDWLVSSDDNEESSHSRWNKELGEMRK